MKQFKDFSVEILAKRGDVFDIRVVSAASGELQTTIALPRSVDDLLRELQSGGAGAFARSSGTREFTPTSSSGGSAAATPAGGTSPSTSIGQDLFDLLFSSPEVTRALAECMTDAKNADAGVRLKLTMNTRDAAVADLARLPWELMHDETKYKYFALRPDSPVVRYLEVPKPFAVRALKPPLRILVVAANPRRDLALGQERSNLEAALGQLRDIELTFIDDATIQSIATAISEASRQRRGFHVLHYMGHGDFRDGRGVLLLHKEGGGEDAVDAEAFNTVLQAAEDLRLVFLNACNTAQSGGDGAHHPFAGVATALVFEGVPAVVAMQRPVPDAAAIVLAKNFYPYIAKGWPVDAAVSEGRRQMFFASRDSLDWAIPVLFMRSPNGVLFDVADDPPQAGAAPVSMAATLSPTPQPVAAPAPVEMRPTPPVSKPPSRIKMMLSGAALVVVAFIVFAIATGDPEAPADGTPPAATEGAPPAAASAGAEPAATAAPAEPLPVDEARVKELEAAAAKDARNVDARAELGLMFRDANRYDDAIPWLEQAVALQPKDLDLSSELARTYGLAGDTAKAERQFAAALAADPRHPQTLAFKGMYLADQQHIDEAIPLWEEVVRIAPDSIAGKWAADTLRELQEPVAGAKPGGSITTEGRVGFRLINGTGVQLHELYVSPNNVKDKGEDVLGDFLLEPGETKGIAFRTLSRSCLWDFIAKDAKGAEFMWRDVDICGDPVLTVRLDKGTPVVTRADQ